MAFPYNGMMFLDCFSPDGDITLIRFFGLADPKILCRHWLCNVCTGPIVEYSGYAVKAIFVLTGRLLAKQCGRLTF